ncbi:MAG TPA: 16S rRNA (cytosine(1402)-N(4))-methyltransferase RsmH [Candidatus Omnitrophota bacterium]|nr:16S rRNA (cytosine(1402)-N(4))-methyltransferase RsmH [Candidatus Omnitrophota bacterium]
MHVPVLLREVLTYLDCKPGEVIVDATLGTAGHSQAILEQIIPGGKLICIDRDTDSIAVARERLQSYGDSVIFCHGNFADIDRHLSQLNIAGVDGMLFDFGISSFQLRDPSRGLSFQEEGPLDMRLDRTQEFTAKELVNSWGQEEIAVIIKEFGQERWCNRIARAIVEARKIRLFETTTELEEVVFRAVPAKFRHYRIHPATRTFQAIRIAVNCELDSISQALGKSIGLLHSGARICAISFHSLEDRIVKHTFRDFARQGLLEILTRKPVEPAEEEVHENPQSRSSKLRAAERV